MNPSLETVPHNAEAEESVIGAVMIDSDWLDYLTLLPEDFYIHRYRFIWRAILAVRASGLGIDYLTVTHELERQNNLGEIGGAAALTQVIARVPDAYHADSYADIIKDMAVRRGHIELANQIVKQAYNGGVDTAAAIEVLSSGSMGNRDGRHISAGLVDLGEDVSRRIKDPQDTWGITTGFIDWDKKTGGIHKQQVLLLAGESGLGKTTIMLQSALAAAQAGHGVAIFEKEMDEQRTLRRLVEIDCGVPNRAMLTGRMNGYEAQFTNSVERLSDLPIYINDDPVSTTADMRGVIARTRVKMEIDAIYLDYLGLLGDKAPGNSNDYDQTKAVRFRELCRQLDLAGFAIQDMVKAEGSPNLKHLSGGAKVRYGADMVFFIIQDQENEQAHYLKPAKERDGDTGKSFIPLTRQGLAFKDAAHKNIDLRQVA